MWVRGLKQPIAIQERLQFHVAPHVGAWIETFNFNGKTGNPVVAPHVGAWIETHRHMFTSQIGELSHPMWVRGLKLTHHDGEL